MLPKPTPPGKTNKRSHGPRSKKLHPRSDTVEIEESQVTLPEATDCPRKKQVRRQRNPLLEKEEAAAKFRWKKRIGNSLESLFNRTKQMSGYFFLHTSSDFMDGFAIGKEMSNWLSRSKTRHAIHDLIVADRQYSLEHEFDARGESIRDEAALKAVDEMVIINTLKESSQSPYATKIAKRHIKKLISIATKAYLTLGWSSLMVLCTADDKILVCCPGHYTRRRLTADDTIIRKSRAHRDQ